MSSAVNGTLHVLTVHFNTPALASSLVRRLPLATPNGRPLVIHVLDNCSTPENLRELRDRLSGLDSVTLDAIDENIGFGAGMNFLAVRHGITSSDVLWLLNPDTRLEPGCLENLENALDEGQFDIVSPFIFSGEGEAAWIWYCGGDVERPSLRVRHRLYGAPTTSGPTDAFATDFVTGAAPMMRASVFHAIGGFPDDYFLYWEDAQFSWKARELGLRLGVIPSARLWHAVGASSGYGLSPVFYYWATRNRFVYARDTGIARRRLTSGRGALESLRPIVWALRERDQRFRKVRAAMRGTRDGVRQFSRAR
ncbi:MAG: glycosyltransferase family 2 protein [Mycobacterium sp.]|jgi:GT2 family glycosyltransferase|nr:MAG: glycosyltransferase family 2 protein [Mycobacterium sp.]SHT66143.1 putative glycosyltransferase [Mycobacteroides abscessus subsp. abscessus]